jgi:hypothetical protein
MLPPSSTGCLDSKTMQLKLKTSYETLIIQVVKQVETVNYVLEPT